MKLVFTSYAGTPEFTEPSAWLKRIRGYTGLLSELGRKHHVTSIERIDYEGTVQEANVDYLFTRVRKRTTWFPFRQHRIIRKLQPDIVFVNGLIFPLQLIQLRRALGRGTRIIVFHRSEKPGPGIRRWLQRISDRFVDAYLFASADLAKEWIRQGVISQEGKIAEVLHGSSVFVPANKEQARIRTGVVGDPVFLWVGRLDANKDPMTVARAFREYNRVNPGARLYMIFGTDDLKAGLAAFVRQHRLDAVIRLIGRIPHDELGNWYNSADFFIAGSHYEGGGIAVCEAISCGCIPVLTDIPSFRKITGPGHCGILYKAGDEAGLVAALNCISQKDRGEERRKTLQRFNEEFSFAAIAGKMEKAVFCLSRQTRDNR